MDLRIERGEGLKSVAFEAVIELTGGGIDVDVTVASFEEMEPIYGGLARRRATLGVTGWGM